MARCQKIGSVEKDRELFLDTQGTCFLCLKDHSSVGENDAGLKEVSFRDVSRYLEIRGLQGSLKNKEGSSQKAREQFNFAVGLCETCSAQVDQFSELVRLFEEIKTKLAQGLETFQEIFSVSQEAEECKQQWEKIRKIDSPDVLLVEYLRMEAGKKCSEKLKDLTDLNVDVDSISNAPSEGSNSQLNAASLPRTDENQTASGSEIETPEEEDASGAPTTAVSTEELMADTCVTEHDYSSNEPSAASSSSGIRKSSKEAVVKMFEKGFQRSKTSKQFQCLQCKFTCSVTKPANIRNHVLARHLQVIFPNLPTIPAKMFGKCVMDLMKLKSTKDNSVPENRESFQEKTVVCLFCNKSFRGKGGYKYHLVMEHYSMLEENLKNHLEEHGTDLEEMLELTSDDHQTEGVGLGLPKGMNSHEPCRSAARIGKYKCAVWSGGCGKAFRKSEALRKHKGVCEKKSKKAEDGGEASSSKNTPNRQQKRKSSMGLKKGDGRKSKQRKTTGNVDWTCNVSSIDVLFGEVPLEVDNGNENVDGGAIAIEKEDPSTGGELAVSIEMAGEKTFSEDEKSNEEEMGGTGSGTVDSTVEGGDNLFEFKYDLQVVKQEDVNDEILP